MYSVCVCPSLRFVAKTAIEAPIVSLGHMYDAAACHSL